MNPEKRYTLHLDYLNRFFPGRELLTVSDICAFTGMDRRSVHSYFPFEGKYITKPNLALRLCDLGKPVEGGGKSA